MGRQEQQLSLLTMQLPKAARADYIAATSSCPESLSEARDKQKQKQALPPKSR